MKNIWKNHRIIPKGTKFFLFAINDYIIYPKDIVVKNCYPDVEIRNNQFFGTLQTGWIGGFADKYNGHIMVELSKTDEYKN